MNILFDLILNNTNWSDNMRWIEYENRLLKHIWMFDKTHLTLSSGALDRAMFWSVARSLCVLASNIYYR
jgi:hypothetical protein